MDIDQGERHRLFRASSLFYIGLEKLIHYIQTRMYFTAIIRYYSIFVVIKFSVKYKVYCYCNLAIAWKCSLFWINFVITCLKITVFHCVMYIRHIYLIKEFLKENQINKMTSQTEKSLWKFDWPPWNFIVILNLFSLPVNKIKWGFIPG